MSLPVPAEEYKRRARNADPLARAAVAADPQAPPELLYYLSSDGDDGVRQAAAGNMATPLQAAPAQVKDGNIQVRAALARKVCRILPRLGQGTGRQTALNTLDALCRDTAVEVRQAVAATLQDTAFLPRELAVQLAGDSERMVAAPVLRFCLSLSDDDLLNLIRSAGHDWVPVEIAHRNRLSNSVALAVWESGNTEAITALLANPGAGSLPEVLEQATDEAAVVTSYQAPLVRHPDLSSPQMERLAAFVDGALLGLLDERARLASGELADVSAVIRRRLDWAERRRETSGAARAHELFGQGQLDDAALADAMAWGERDFVISALALLAGTDEGLVAKVLEHQSPKGITALCWKAGLSMRTCRQVQIRIGRVPLGRALYARGGFDYPLPVQDLRWHLEFYGILPA